MFRKYEPVRYYFMMSRKSLSCSFVKKVYDNFNKVFYYAITWNHFSEESQLFLIS